MDSEEMSEQDFCWGLMALAEQVHTDALAEGNNQLQAAAGRMYHNFAMVCEA